MSTNGAAAPIRASDALKKKLAKIGLHSEADLLVHLPLRYEDETRITPVARAFTRARGAARGPATFAITSPPDGATYLIDPSLVIIAGGAAAQVAPLLPRLEAKLSELTPLPPAIETSTLGRDVVLLGAIHNAIRQVRAATLTRHLHTPTTMSA